MDGRPARPGARTEPGLQTGSPHEQAADLGFHRRVAPEMSLRVSTRSAPCRVVRVCAGQSVAGFVWRFRHLPLDHIRDISLPDEQSPRRSIFTFACKFEYDLTSLEMILG